MPRDSKESKIVRIEHPGEKFWEQIGVNGEHKYAFYRPPNKLSDNEIVNTDTFNVGVAADEETTIHYIPLSRCPWPLPKEPVKPKADLWNEVSGFVYRHVDLPDERLYNVITAWIHCTWILEAWIAVPYLHLLGPKKSGKTRLLEVLKALCYRGILSSNISEAALFRSVEAFKPTLLLDETEIYGKEERAAVQNLLNSGYRRGQYVIRVGGMEEGRPKLELFEVFGFKALAGTGGFKDTLESRSIRINMEQNVRPVENFVDQAKARELRSQLLYWRFRRLSEVSDISEVNPRVAPKELGFADGRFLELYTPLVTIANQGKKDIVGYARESYEVMMDEEQTSIEAQVLAAIVKCRPNLETGKFSTSLVTQLFNENRSEKERWGSRSMGRVIKRLGFRPKRMTGGAAGYVYDENRIARLSKRYGLTPETTSLTSLTSLDNSLDVPPAEGSLQDKMDWIAGELSHSQASSLQLANKLGIPLTEMDSIMSVMERDKVVFRPLGTNIWRLA